jgi:hypothetical protein
MTDEIEKILTRSLPRGADASRRAKVLAAVDQELARPTVFKAPSRAFWTRSDIRCAAAVVLLLVIGVTGNVVSARNSDARLRAILGSRGPVDSSSVASGSAASGWSFGFSFIKEQKAQLAAHYQKIRQLAARYENGDSYEIFLEIRTKDAEMDSDHRGRLPGDSSYYQLDLDRSNRLFA